MTTSKITTTLFFFFPSLFFIFPLSFYFSCISEISTTSFVQFSCSSVESIHSSLWVPPFNTMCVNNICKPDLNMIVNNSH